MEFKTAVGEKPMPEILIEAPIVVVDGEMADIWRLEPPPPLVAVCEKPMVASRKVTAIAAIVNAVERIPFSVLVVMGALPFSC